MSHDAKKMSKQVRFAVIKHDYYVNNEYKEEYKKLNALACVCDEELKKIELKKSSIGSKRQRSSMDEVEVDTRVVNEALKEFITGEEIDGTNIKLVIQKTLYETDLKRSQHRLNIPFKQVETHDFLTDEEKEILVNKEGIKVRVIGPTFMMYEKPLWLKIWSMSKNHNYVLNTNWCNFVEANRKVLKVNTTIQVWSFRQDEQLCFAILCVDKPVVQTTSVEYSSSTSSSSLNS
uniref:B3 domain-containing protein, DNA-binding pseudobarrel domain protein n=1 Tax=Tanacetum cinerariifolium TaxID=118510 RepID=A0A699GI14_TANCI|nr:B3 domain-containing protein, DNA-binding pseudobarrel domain protein [Tanacetum cinerariifolium]GEY57322.1 B3 domain-containing protein, DNA-binding pseudobarrel domain protein [Tanacetum cinerariifolium]